MFVNNITDIDVRSRLLANKVEVVEVTEESLMFIVNFYAHIRVDFNLHTEQQSTF